MSHPIEKLSSKYPSQDTLTKMYGCNKYQLGDKMRNSFHIPDEYLAGLSIYTVRHFSGEEFKSVLRDGMIPFFRPTEDKLQYAVIYHNCTPYAARRAKEIRLSYRAAQDEFNLEPIVLVQIVDSGEQE